MSDLAGDVPADLDPAGELLMFKEVFLGVVGRVAVAAGYLVTSSVDLSMGEPRGFQGKPLDLAGELYEVDLAKDEDTGDLAPAWVIGNEDLVGDLRR